MIPTRPKHRPRAWAATAMAVAAIILGGCSIAAGLESPAAAAGYDRTGKASWYGERYHGRTTASGVRFDMNAMTAAHPPLPTGTLVRVTNLQNSRSVVVVIADRGPVTRKRIIDLSYAAAKHLGFITQGTAKVRVTYLKPAVRG